MNGQNTNELIRPGKNTRWVNFLFELAEIMCAAMIGIAVLFTFVLRPAGVIGSSMQPTLEEGQMLAVAVLPQPGRGDIVILSSNNGHKKPLVKRVIAVAGDEVDLIGGLVLVNGQPIDEPYLPDGLETYPALDPPIGMEYPVRVPPGHVFVLGDNRGDSSDSRSSMVGFVRDDDILGKAIFRVSPFSPVK